MSRGNEVPKQEGIGFDNPPVAESRQDTGRTGLSSETAHREMDKFRGPDSYTTRKLIGRKRALLLVKSAEVEQ